MSKRSAYNAAVTYFRNLKGNPNFLATTPDEVFNGHLVAFTANAGRMESMNLWEKSTPVKANNGVTILSDGRLVRPADWKVIAGGSSNSLVNRPTTLKLVNVGHHSIRKELWVAGEKESIARFDPESGGYLGGFSYDTEGASDLAVSLVDGAVAIAYPHTSSVVVYTPEGEELEELTPPSKPVSVAWAGGSLIVACVDRLVAYSFDLSSYSVLLEGRGNAWSGGIFNPTSMAVDGDQLYICYGDSHYVACFEIETEPTLKLNYECVYGGHGCTPYQQPTSVCVDNQRGLLLVAYSEPDKVVAFDLQTHSLVGSFGSGCMQPCSVAGIRKPTGIVCHGSSVFVTSWSGNKLVSFPADMLYGEQEVLVEYTAVNVKDRYVVRASRENVSVTESGKVYLKASKEELFEGLLSEPDILIVLKEVTL